ncbi:FAD-binding oxidoreductase [Thermomicrobiaceae bacterium CFH 74404]|uniref:FAD-binding oxidoreductase n=1 Tax=Thermalbibacter longus TaxID=2951981 RepID=A0AA41W921_9BACT|nr:FAD-binding oxidoreductase [Thermalbibacter longus]MCM8747529.1 FAD-binding oxidoreductase [Thermalbibacter longus]
MTHDATLSSLTGLDLRPLEQRLRGTLLRPGMATYDSARQLMNRAVTRRPAAIAQVADSQDVVEVVRFARDRGLPLGVRSGGHSPAGYGMVDDALVVDLSGMKRVTIDPDARLARVEAGVTSGELAAFAQPHGLAISTGDTSSVGFGGLATGGGIGFMVRKYGLTIDNLIAAQVVTASGKLVTASEQEHPDLFWAIRGGGGNFGIITEFIVRLAEVRQILGGDLVLPASREVIRGYLDYVADAPEGLTTIAHLMHAPPAPYIPEARVGEVVLSILVTWVGDESEGQRAVAPLRALAEPVADTIAWMPYPAIFNFTAHQAVPICHAIRSVLTHEVSDEVVDAALEAVERANSPFSLVQFRGLGGAMARVGREATAFAHRDARYMVTLLALWMDENEDATPHRAWIEAVWPAIRATGTGVYVNFLEEEGHERIRQAYPLPTLARLAEVKRTYDPHNMFRFNQNIAPAMSA